MTTDHRLPSCQSLVFDRRRWDLRMDLGIWLAMLRPLSDLILFLSPGKRMYLYCKVGRKECHFPVSTVSKVCSVPVLFLFMPNTEFRTHPSILYVLSLSFILVNTDTVQGYMGTCLCTFFSAWSCHSFVTFSASSNLVVVVVVVVVSFLLSSTISNSIPFDRKIRGTGQTETSRDEIHMNFPPLIFLILNIP